ncbi:Guanyl-specific ribonuclease Sa [Corynebacterium glucuronolyticum]|nr:Guanyl-specific ribonuclease Sa [Corynebacterium glucuronolyticum DSM 44120]SMB84909.1 Guanyl-specific ribonuclease Sa [Corynebacterium glucuronolyticum]
MKKGSWILGLLVAVVAAYFGIDLTTDGNQHQPQNSPSGAICPIDSLPKEARTVADSIESGGPYAFPGDDNTHFGNYQNRLPKENSQYYREFTVPTPGIGHRGERRIVVGGGTKTDPDTWYYTGDHYDSFCEIPDAED